MLRKAHLQRSPRLFGSSGEPVLQCLLKKLAQLLFLRPVSLRFSQCFEPESGCKRKVNLLEGGRDVASNNHSLVAFFLETCFSYWGIHVWSCSFSKGKLPPVGCGMTILQFPKPLSSPSVVAQVRWLADPYLRETPGSPFLQPSPCCGTVKFKGLCSY